MCWRAQHQQNDLIFKLQSKQSNLLQNACINQVLQCWKPFLDRKTDQSHGEDEAEVEVTHDGPSHQPSTVVVTRDAS